VTVTLDSRPRLVAWARLRRDPVSGGMLLLYPEKGLALSATGEAVLGLCEGNRSVRDIAATLAASHGAALAVVTADVLAFLGSLEDRGLLQPGVPS